MLSRHVYLQAVGRTFAGIPDQLNVLKASKSKLAEFINLRNFCIRSSDWLYASLSWYMPPLEPPDSTADTVRVGVIGTASVAGPAPLPPLLLLLPPPLLLAPPLREEDPAAAPPPSPPSSTEERGGNDGVRRDEDPDGELGVPGSSEDALLLLLSNGFKGSSANTFLAVPANARVGHALRVEAGEREREREGGPGGGPGVGTGVGTGAGVVWRQQLHIGIGTLYPQWTESVSTDPCTMEGG